MDVFNKYNLLSKQIAMLDQSVQVFHAKQTAQSFDQLLLPSFLANSKAQQQSFKIYCPVCCISYLNSDRPAHIKKHQLSIVKSQSLDTQKRTSWGFSSQNMQTPTLQSKSFVKSTHTAYLPATNGTYIPPYNNKQLSAITADSSRGTVLYPLIEPIEINTRDFAEKRSSVSRLGRSLKVENREVYPVLEVRDQATQTVDKPPLQKESANSNLFNCFDNIMRRQYSNEQCRQSSVYDDVFSNNCFVPAQKQLTQWEKENVHKL